MHEQKENCLTEIKFCEVLKVRIAKAVYNHRKRYIYIKKKKKSNMKKMKDVLFSVNVLQCLFVVRGSDFYESSFSNIVGCLERTQVTFLIRGPYFSFNENMIYQLMEFLSESPCHTPYILSLIHI